jgi:tRNA (guanine37-N1)-methyltransferase
MIFHLLTIFPDMFQGPLSESILWNARDKKFIDVQIHDIRDYSTERHHKVDDTPYGGGAGMVMTCQPLFDAIEDLKKKSPKGTKVIYMTPGGKRLTQSKVERLAKLKGLIIVCGRYEGIDQRVIDTLIDEEISIGDYVLSGGEIPACVVVDAVARLVPGVLGNEASHQEESFSKKLDRKKEYPHYTKPAEFRGMNVPDVLKSGNHKEIDKWRREHLR